MLHSSRLCLFKLPFLRLQSKYQRHIMLGVVACLWPATSKGWNTNSAFVSSFPLITSQVSQDLEGAEPSVPDQRSWLWHIQDEKLLFTQLMFTSCSLHPLVTAKHKWIQFASRNYNVMLHFCLYSPSQSIICFVFLAASEMNYIYWINQCRASIWTGNSETAQRHGESSNSERSDLSPFPSSCTSTDLRVPKCHSCLLQQLANW